VREVEGPASGSLDEPRVNELAQLVVNGVATGSIIAIAAVGASLVFGVLRIGNFAHGDYLTLGAYAGVTVTLTLGLALPIALLVGMAVTAIFAVLMEFLIFRPMRGKGSASVFIVTIGLALVLRHVIYLLAGSKSYQYPLDQTQVFDLGIVRLSPGQLVVIVGAAITIPLVSAFLSRSRTGKSMRAVSDNADLAAVSGIAIDRIAVYTWALAGLLAGLAGVLLALLQGSFDPEMGWSILFLIFTAVILGGIGSPYGALVGGLALGLVMDLATWSALPGGGLETRYKPVLAFAFLIVLLLVRPQGVFGRARLR
jgi:branched-subunit amino acid ABC-type transport system permease component